MSLLLIQIAPKPRQRARALPAAASGETAPAPGGEFDFVFSDGREAEQVGRASADRMPRADSVVAVLCEADVSWHRVQIPKAAPNRMRAALAGAMEDGLLDDPVNLHFALGPGARPGDSALVAVTDRRWLTAALAAIERVSLTVDRIVPTAWPVDPPAGHFSAGAAGDGVDQTVRLHWADAQGVAVLDLGGGLARSLLSEARHPETRFTATPAAAAAAEQWLGAPVALLTDAQRLQQAAASPWNLRQFELARRAKGSRALRDIWRALLTPAWRPVRLGLAALLVVNLVGLNVHAAHLRGEIADKRTQTIAVLRETFPQVTGILDAPLQMRREVETLRAAAGKPGGADLEPLLLAAAAAWPPGRSAAANLRFEPGRLSIAAADWQPGEVERFSAQLRAGGYQVLQADGRLQLSPAPGPGN